MEREVTMIKNIMNLICSLCNKSYHLGECKEDPEMAKKLHKEAAKYVNDYNEKEGAGGWTINSKDQLEESLKFSGMGTVRRVPTEKEFNPSCRRCWSKDEVSNPKDIVGSKKTPLSLVPSEGIRQIALAMKSGADKYGVYNWRNKKVQTMIYIDAILRHTLEYLDREDKDKDSGLHPLAHVGANVVLLLDAIKHGNIIDNRPQNEEKS